MIVVAALPIGLGEEKGAGLNGACDARNPKTRQKKALWRLLRQPTSDPSSLSPACQPILRIVTGGVGRDWLGGLTLGTPPPEGVGRPSNASRPQVHLIRSAPYPYGTWHAIRSQLIDVHLSRNKLSLL